MKESKKASGRNIPEAERNTVAIKLRLDGEDAEMLRAYARAWKCSLSEVVSSLLRSSDDSSSLLHRSAQAPSKEQETK